MENKLHRLPLAAVLSAIVLAILLSACGSSSSDSSPSTTTASGGPSKSNGNPLSLGEKEQGEKAEQGEQGASSFIKPNSPNNKYAKFGKEASSAELSAASEVLAESFEARESADFPAQCATLSVKTNEEIAETKSASGAKTKCPEVLKTLASPLENSEEARANNFGGLLDAFRVEGSKGYALYHGNDRKDWMMPMVKEGSTWKATSILATEV